MLIQFGGTNFTSPDSTNFEAALGEMVHLHEPLVGEERLDHLAAAIAARHLQAVRPGFDQQAGGFEVGDDELACFEAIEAAIFFGDVVARGNHLRRSVKMLIIGSAWRWPTA